LRSRTVLQQRQADRSMPGIRESLGSDGAHTRRKARDLPLPETLIGRPPPGHRWMGRSRESNKSTCQWSTSRPRPRTWPAIRDWMEFSSSVQECSNASPSVLAMTTV
jgi:hypothetical protein